MKKLLLGVFVGLLILGITAPVWALEVTVGGEFRFRARQRTDFDLQAFNLNSGAGVLTNNVGVLTGSISPPAAGVGPYDLHTWDNPVGALTYGGTTIIRNGALQQNILGPTAFVFNVVTGQFAINAAAAGTNSFVFDGSAAEEHFGYSLATGRLNDLRPNADARLTGGVFDSNRSHRRELARPHADVGNANDDRIYDRIRVSVDAKIVEGLRAYVMFENYSDWGLMNTTATNEPRSLGGGGSSNIYGDRQSLNIRFAWVDFVIPKTPIHVKVGRQPIALGHGILLDTRTWGGDMAYVYAPIGPVTVGALYGKFIEGNRAFADDANFWGLHADFAINPTNKISTFYRYAWNRLGRYNDLFTTGLSNVGTTFPNRNRRLEQEQHGWGIAFDGKVGPFFYAAEADILWGKYADWQEARGVKPWGYWDYMNARTPLQMQEDLYQVAWGYGVQLGVDLKWIKLDVAHSYGSGDKTRASNTKFFAHDGNGLFVPVPMAVAGGAAPGVTHHQWTTGRRVETFDAWGSDNMYSPWSTDIFMASGKSSNFGSLGLGTAGFTRRWGYTGDFGDIIMVKPTLTVLPLANLTADISYAAFWKSSNTNSNGAGVGTVADGEYGGIVLWKSNLNNREQPNKQSINPFLGQEINTHLTWYPYKNLLIKGWAGVFFPGDWFKVQQRTSNNDVSKFLSGVFGFPQDGHDSVGLKPAWALQLDVIVTF